MSAKIKAFLISIFMFVFSANAYVVNYTPFNPDYIDFDISNTDEYLFENDIVIADDAMLAPGRIKINGSVIIENNGTVQSSIEICDGCQVIIKNRGQINCTAAFRPQSRQAAEQSSTRKILNQFHMPVLRGRFFRLIVGRVSGMIGISADRKGNL